MPLHIEDGAGRLHSFVSTTTVFGAPLNVTLSEIAIETFLPIGDEIPSPPDARLHSPRSRHR